MEAPMEMPICVGFGDARVLRDGETVYDGEREWERGREPWTVQDAENLAAADPDHDWRILMHGALSGRTFRRNDVGKWIEVASNQGFA